MFEKFKSQSAPKASTPKVELTVTTEFVRALVKEGLRLSYASLTTVARELGEDSSTQKAGQRGAKLVKSLPLNLQPYVCRQGGGYHKKVLGQFEDLPEGLKDLQVIVQEDVLEALAIWQEAQDS